MGCDASPDTKAAFAAHKISRTRGKTRGFSCRFVSGFRPAFVSRCVCRYRRSERRGDVWRPPQPLAKADMPMRRRADSSGEIRPRRRRRVARAQSASPAGAARGRAAWQMQRVSWSREAQSSTLHISTSAEGENILASLFEDGIVSLNHCIADCIPSIFRLHEPPSALAHFVSIVI